MQFTLLLLVVFVSATLATPYYLRRGPGGLKGPGGRKPEGSSKDRLGGLQGGDKPGSSEEGSGKGKEGPCERAMKRCDDVEEIGTKRSESDQLAANEDVKDCEKLIEDELSELKADKRRGMKRNFEQDFNELGDKINLCKEMIESCASSTKEPVARLLRMMGRNGENNEEDPCTAVYKEMEDMLREEGPCERAMKRCDDVEEVGTKRSESDQLAANEDVKDCERLLEEELKELEADKRRGMNRNFDEALQEFEKDIGNCMLEIEACTLPDSPVARALQMLAGSEGQGGQDPCEAAFERLEKMETENEDSEDIDSESNDLGDKRKLLRELIRKIYSKK